jgi:hypothetical protein
MVMPGAKVGGIMFEPGKENVGSKTLVVATIAVIGIVMVLIDRPITIAANDTEPSAPKSTPHYEFAAQAWAR